MNLEELKNAEHNIIDIAESRGLGLLGVMEPTGPVDSDVGVLAIELNGGADWAAGGGLAETEEAVKYGAVLADVEALEVTGVDGIGEGLGGDGGEEADVVVGVEAADVDGAGGKGAVDLHPTVEAVMDD